MARPAAWAAAWLAAVALAAAPAAAQAAKKDKCWVCGEDPKIMAAAGIVNHGPFPFFNSDSEDVQTHLGAKTMLWLESTHFRIGSDLKDWRIPVEEKKAYRAELEALALKFPAIDPRKIGTLDRALRIHLFAERLEKMYADMLGLVQCTDEQFMNLPPEEKFLEAWKGDWNKVLVDDYNTRPPRPPEWPNWVDMGRYFGMPMKFEVMMLHYKGDMERFKRDYIGHENTHPQRWHCTVKVDVGQPKSRCLWFGFSTEAEEMKHDQHVHNALLHNVGINMLDAYMLYLVEAPFWLRTGVGHWLTQRNSTDYNFYDLDEGAGEMGTDERNWPAAVRKLVVAGAAPTLLQLAKLQSYGEMNLVDHLVSWSKFCFLREKDPAACAKFILLLKKNPNFTANLDAQRDALQQAYGYSFQQAEDAWKEWVLATYPVK